MQQAPSRLKADMLLVAVSAVWGAAFVAQSFAGKSGIAFLYNGACFSLAGLVLLPMASPTRKPSRSESGWMLLAGLFLFGGSALQQVGLYYTQVANVSFLTTLYVIFTPFLLWLGYRERPKVVHAVAAALATLGAFLLSTGGELALHFGDVLETIGALAWGCHLILVGKYASRYDALRFACAQFLVCGVLNLAAGFVSREPAHALVEPTLVAAVAYRGLLSIAVGYTAQVWAQKFTSPTEAALIFSLESVFGAVCAAFVLGERLVPWQIVGCALIFVAAALSQVPEKPAEPVSVPR
jgi:drug/metabolite transporter (DMT)-like permease